MCKRLSADIQRIKAQKVAVQKTMEASAKQFNQWRVEKEKELIQLRRQNRRNVATIQALEAMKAKNSAVLQRKIADATAARKKLRELQVSVCVRARVGCCTHEKLRELQASGSWAAWGPMVIYKGVLTMGPL